MKGFIGDIEEMTERNMDFRHVLYTGKHLQLVLMSIPPGEDVGEETHPATDQFFRIVEGEGEVWIDGKRSPVKEDDAILIPAGASHNLVNTGQKPLKFYTLYAPPEHRDGLVESTKAQAMAEDEQFDGVTTEK